MENCVGCNRCVRECPIETANLTYQDAQGNIKIDVDDAQCIACGRCIQVCRHGARSYEDDLERFFDDLDRGVPLSLITAPSQMPCRKKSTSPPDRRNHTGHQLVPGVLFHANIASETSGYSRERAWQSIH
ncbi:4Fe-4S dicluster domain-containing protein [Oxalobacter vibrioformis]|uniref:4Fe-4S dicluster domain-containing protein n=1 Tax=Oxalobacter vibrioformis TaxID=933080 RepID=UPI0038CDA4CB